MTIVSDAKDLGDIRMRSTPTEAPNTGGGSVESAIFNQQAYLTISQKRCKTET